MKTEIHRCSELSINEFADRHGLVMDVRERLNPENENERFYAAFRNCNLVEDDCLVGAFGNGSSPVQAINDYAFRISMATLSITLADGSRRKFSAQKILPLNKPLEV